MKEENYVVRCPMCKTLNVTYTEHRRRTPRPNSELIQKYRKMSYFFVFNRYVCECGHTWDDPKYNPKDYGQNNNKRRKNNLH